MQILGEPQLTSPSGQRCRCEGRTLALLTYLALEGATPRAHLADLLWPAAGDAARNNLVQLLRRMERRYGAALCIQGPVLSLSPAVWVDASALLGDGDAVQRAALPDARPLLDGVPIADLPEYRDWVLAWRERLDLLASRHALTRARQLEEAGDLPGAARGLRAVLDAQPLSEEAARALMRVQYLRGDAAGARRTFNAYRDDLARELGVEPMPATLHLHRLIEQGDALTPAAPVPPPPAARVLQLARLVGRSAEWAQMEEAWAAGRCIILRGEPGVGKSRLAGEFLAARGAHLTLSGRPGDAAVPYSTVTRALQALLAAPDAPPLEAAARRALSVLLPALREDHPGPPEGLAGGREALHAAIGALFARRLQDAAGILLDDVQFMDDASADVSAALLTAQSGGRPCVLTCRRGALDEGAAALIEALLGSGRAVLMDLQPLGVGAVEALVEELDAAHLPSADPAFGERLLRFTGGNPLLVLETVRHLLDHPAEDLGASALPRVRRAEHLLAQRLNRLSRTSLQAARAASVLERDFGVDLVAEMLGLPLLDAAGAWEELQEAQVVVNDRFSHDLLAETVLHAIPPSVRRLLHRSAARTLAAHDAAPARVAGQWLGGGREPEAAEWLMKAADAARFTYRPREAEAFYAQAGQLFERLERPHEAFEALMGQAQMIGALEDDRPRQREVVAALVSRAETPHQRAQASLMHGHLLFILNDDVAMERVVREGLAFVQGTGDLRLEAELYEAMAGAMLTARRPQEAQAALTRLLELSEELGHVSWQAIAYDGLGQVAAYRSPTEALRLFQHAEALCLSIQDLPGAASGANKQARTEHKLGRFQAGLVSAKRGAAHLSTLDGYRIRRLINTWTAVQCWHALGEYEAALIAIDAAQQAHRETESDWLDVLELHRARLLLDLGQLEAARAAAERVMASDRYSSSLDVDRHSMWAAVLAAHGHMPEALAALAAAEALLQVHEDVYWWPRVQLERAALLPAAQALPLLQEARAQARHHHLRGLEVAAQVRLARAQLTLNLPPELPELQAPESVVSPGELLLTRALVWRRAADPRAAAAFEDARTWLHRAAARLPAPWREEFMATPLATAIEHGALVT